MPSAMLSAIAGVLLPCLAEASLESLQDPVWFVGNLKQACKDVCLNQFVSFETKHCATAAWPTSVFQLTMVVREAGVICTSMQEETAGAGALPGSAEKNNVCSYTKDVKTMGCLEAADGVRQLCPCARSPAVWKVGRALESCDQTCKAYDGGCALDKALAPTSKETGAVTSASAGAACFNWAAGAAGENFHPSKKDRWSRDCQWANTANSFDCAEVPTGTNLRLCPCVDADEERDTVARPSASQRRCNRKDSEFTPGKEGVGGTKQQTSDVALTREQCLELVLEECPGASAATWVQTTKRCFCETNIVALQTNPLADTCWFTDA